MAIHKVKLCSDSEPGPYMKSFRKALMTGGAVVEIDDSLSEADASSLHSIFSKEAHPNGVCELVVKELVLKFPKLDEDA